ncbi:hypothetical protein F5Y14DRAFT_225030 [Nemania sp. NC0429]|nr:hypothetical protein F5Y14DRAFT_225030 [Nemania sp. NC0429]
MLPSRGLTRQPASALLRHSLSSRIHPVRTIPTRQFSQASSQSPLLPRQSSLSRSSGTPSRYGPTASPTLLAGRGPSPSVFAQRAGAARNLSLWPFSSKPKEEPQILETASQPPPPPSPSQSPAVTQQPPSVNEPVLSTVAEPTTNTTTTLSTADPSSLSPLSDDFLRELDPESLLDIPERIGFLEELGFDFGHGPTGACAWLLEHVHVYTGLPWWGSIAVVALLFRAALFFPTLGSTRQQAKLQKLRSNPAFAQAEAEFKEAAYRTRDQAAMLLARSKMSRLKKAAGVSMWRSFVGLAMIPFSYGMFNVLRNMGNLPVPGFEAGGLAWFTDLAVHDPFYILPLVSAASSALMFKQMQAANVAPVEDEMAKTLAKGMIWVLPPLMFIGTAWLASGIQWFFFVLTLGTILQTRATLNPAFRRWADLPPLPTPDTQPARTIPGGLLYQSPTPSSIKKSFQGGMEAASKSLMAATGNTDEKARWKKVQEYETQRAEEERQKAAKRLEDARRRRAGRH